VALLKRGIKPIVQFLGDAANMYRGIKHTFMGFKVVNLRPKAANSPFATREFVGFEAGDSYDQYRRHAQLSLDAINEWIRAGAWVTVHGTSFQCEVVSGGDQASVHAFLSMGSCNGPFPCAYCPVPVEKLGTKCGAAIAPRDLTTIRLLAHTVPGVCPACNETVTPETIAKFGKPVPSTFDEKKHFGVGWGKTPLLDIGVADWVICLLHCNLCIVKGLWEKVILPGITTEELAIRVNAELEYVGGIYCKLSKLKPKKKNVSEGTSQQQLRSHAFHGRDAEKLLICIDRIIAIVFPCLAPVLLEAVQRPEKKRKQVWVTALFSQWRAAWFELNTSFSDDGRGGIGRLEYAARCHGKIEKFIVTWVDNVGKTEGLYLHILHKHVREQIERHGSLVGYQVQGLEHNNHIRKVDKYLTNKKNKGQLFTRVAQGLGRQLVKSKVTPTPQLRYKEEQRQHQHDLRRARTIKRNMEINKLRGWVPVNKNSNS
jgi:hypothetical protein